MLVQYVLEPQWIYFLALPAALILFYLIRPKPRKQTVPSLMFFLRDQGKSKFLALFQFLSRNFLLFLQLLILLLFILALLRPFLPTTSETKADDVIFVIDGSASMNALFDSQSRFSAAKSYLEENLGERNTIIFARDHPFVIAEKETGFRTKTLLSRVDTTDTPGKLGSSMLLALEKAEKGSTIYILSDFLEENLNLAYFQNLVEGKDAKVIFKDFSSRIANIGFIGMQMRGEELELTIKNFNQVNETVHWQLKGGDLAVKKDPVSLGPREVKKITITPIPKGAIEIIIDNKDDFSTDNILYFVGESEQRYRTLYLTNTIDVIFETAITYLPYLDIEEISPPTSFTPELYDLIIINNVNTNMMLPGTMKKLRDHIRDGAKLIIVAQPQLLNIDFQALLPLSYSGTGQETIIELGPDKDIIAPQEGFFDINFGTVNQFLKFKPIATTKTIATDSTGNFSIIATYPLGRGKILYYGLQKEYSDFSATIDHHKFWKRAIDYLLEKEHISKYNKKTAEFLEFAQPVTVKYPGRKQSTTAVDFAWTGFYQIGNSQYAANLLSIDESKTTKDLSQTLSVPFAEKESAFDKKEYTTTALVLLLIFVLIELIYVKTRGDF